MNDLAPIVLFVYSRPWHTEQTLRALEKNDLAKESTLYIYADGTKDNITSDQLEKVQEVRMLIKRAWNFKKVNIIEREKNWGLADNIVDGVTTIVNQYSKIIVLEDDIATSRGFLKYMNDALNIYDKENKVMHISGYMFPVKKTLPSSFFYNTASCWGWGTWKRAWKHYNNDADQNLKLIEQKKLISKFDIENTYKFSEQLRANASGTLKTWAIKWYASFFIQKGFALHPYPSLTNNIGFDGSGENCTTFSVFEWDNIAESIEIKPSKIQENYMARKMMRIFNRNLSKSDLSLMGNLKKIVPGFIKHSIKLLINKDYQQQIRTTKELQIIRKKNRFEEGNTNLLQNNLRFTDSASFCFIYDELFNKEIYKFITNNPTPYIIDAGANIGLGMIYFKKLYPNAEIVAFEPDENVFKVLESNIKSFGFENVSLIKKALWNEETTLKFFSEGADGGRIASDNDKTQLIEIKTERLRSYLNRKVDFLKIDIEGAETIVLEDCEDLLFNVEKIFVEYHSFVDKPQNLHQLLAILERAGFRYNIQHIGVFSHYPLLKIENYMGMDNQLNIFATRHK